MMDQAAQGPDDVLWEEKRFYYIYDPDPVPRAYKLYREGHIYDHNTAFYLDEISFGANPNVNHHSFLWEQYHPNLLRCYFLNEEKAHILYEPFDETFSVHMHNLKLRGMEPVMRDVVIPHNLGQNIGGVVAPYVPELFRGYIRKMFLFLRFAHELGYYTRGFDIHNLVMKKAKIKFYVLQFERIVEFHEKINRIRYDFKCLHDLIRRQMFENYAIPYEMDRWLSLLLVPESFCMDMEVLERHVALIGYKKRVNLLKEIQYRRDSLGGRFLNTLLSFMGANDGWKANITMMDGPFYECLTWHQSFYSDAIGCANSHLLKFWRNMATHFKEHVSKLNGDYSNKALDAMMMCKYGIQVCSLQERLANHKMTDGVSALSLLLDGR